MITEFVRLDVTNQELTRDMLLNQPDTLFLLPDNTIDYKLPRNKLHQPVYHENNHLRPSLLGNGAYNEPKYDFQRISIATVSYDEDTPLTAVHLVVFLHELQHLLHMAQFKKIAVIYRNGVPDYPVMTNNPEHRIRLQELLNSALQALETYYTDREYLDRQRTEPKPVLKFSPLYLAKVGFYLLATYVPLKVLLPLANWSSNSKAEITDPLPMASMIINPLRFMCKDFKNAAYQEYLARNDEDIQALSPAQLTAYFEGVRSAGNDRVKLENTIPTFEWTGRQLKCKLPAATLHWIAYYAGQEAAEKGDFAVVDHVKTLTFR